VRARKENGGWWVARLMASARLLNAVIGCYDRPTKRLQANLLVAVTVYEVSQ
jgi:hypothetical protein